MGLFKLFSRSANRTSEPAASHTGPTSRVASGGTAGTAASLAAGAITIFAADRRITEFVPGTGVAVPGVPFIVGRVPEDDEDVSRQPVGFFLRDEKPYRLSRRHFSIIRREDQFWILDGSSHLGTVVNGQRIGRKYGRDAAALRHGENQVVAGGVGSEYGFRIVVS